MNKTLKRLTPPIYIKAALNSEPGLGKLIIYGEPSLSMGSSLLEIHDKRLYRKKIDIKLDTLDNIAKLTHLYADLVKLDLQGCELLALKGAKNILQNAEMFIIEFGCLPAYKGRATPREIMDIML